MIKIIILIVIIVILLIIFLSSCHLSRDINPWDFQLKIIDKNDYAFLRFINSNPKNTDDIIKKTIIYVNKKISYKLDVYENYQFPQETIDKKTGDCEDLCFLIIGILKKYFKIEPIFYGVVKKNSVLIGHAMFKVNGVVYNSTNTLTGIPQGFKINTVKHFNELRKYINTNNFTWRII